MGRLRDERGRFVTTGDKVNSTNKRVGLSFGGLSLNIRGAQTAMRGLRATSDATRRAVAATKTAVLATTAAVTALGVKSTFAGLQFNAAFQSANTSFSTMLGSTSKARAFVESLREVSAGTPLRLTEVFDAAKRMLGMEMTARRTARTLRALNAAVLATGGNSDTFQTAALALGQIQAKGKGSAEELMQLAEAGVPVQKILQRELGLTADEVADIARSGIKAEKIIDAIARGWTRKYGKAAERARGDWNNQVAGMRKDWEQLQRVVSEPLFRRLNRDVFPVISRALRAGIRGMEEGGIAGLFAGVDRGLGAGGRIVAVYRAVDSAVRDTAVTVTEWFLPAGKAVIELVRSLPKEAKLAFAGFATVAMVAFGGPLTALAGLVTAAVLIHKHWRAISTFFAGLWSTLKSAGGEALRWVGDQFGLTGDDVKQTWEAIKNATKLAFAAMKLYLAPFVFVFKQVFEHVLLPIVTRVFAGIVQIVQGVVRVIGGVVKVFAGVFTGDFDKAWEGVKQIFSGGAQAVLGVVKAMTAPARTAITGIWKGLAAVAKGAWDGVKSVVEDGVNFLIARVRDILGIYNAIPDALKPGGDIPLPDFIGERGVKEHVQRSITRGGTLRGPASPALTNPDATFGPFGRPMAGTSRRSRRTINLNVGVNVDRREVARASARGEEDGDQWR